MVLMKRMTSLILALVLAAAFMPLTGVAALAEEGEGGQAWELTAEEDGMESWSDEEEEAIEVSGETAVAVQVDDAVAVLDDVSLDDFTQGDEATDEVDIALDPAEFDLEVVDDAGVSIEAANVTLEGDGDEDIEPVIYDDVEVIPEAEGSVDEASKISQTAEAISATPTYGGVFEVYNTYFNWYPYNMAMENMAYDLYMENSADWVNWVRSGYMRANLI